MQNESAHFMDLSDLADRVDQVLPAVSGGPREPIDPIEPTAILLEYRRRLLNQVRADTQANLQELRGYGSSHQNLPVVAGLLNNLEDDFALLEKTKLYGNGKAEIKWCIGLWQFYLDAIAMVEEICRVECGKKPSVYKRIHVGDCDALNQLQAIVNMMEIATPDFLNHNLWRGLLPTVMYYGFHGLFRWAKTGFVPFCRANRAWSRGGQLAAFQNTRKCVPTVENREILDSLLDRSGKTKHNIILGSAHRSGYLDLPVVMEALNGLELGSWCNNAFYGKAMAQKFCDDTFTVPIRGHGAKPLRAALQDTAELMVEHRVPVLIFPEGSTTSVLYGQQLRVKRGTRLAAEEAYRLAKGTGRETFIVPITIGDPIAFLLGQRDSLVVRFHDPIRVSGEFDWRSASLSPDVIDDGDPIALELETLYLKQTEHLRRGWEPMSVLHAVRSHRARSRLQGGMIHSVRSNFNMSLIELARTAGQFESASQG